MSEKDFNWKAFQKHLRYSDEEMSCFKADPKRAAAAKKVFAAEILKKDLVVEIVESHGCSCGLKPGDKLVFNALSQLDLSRSTNNWCAHAMAPIPIIATLVQDRFVTGQPLDNLTYDHFSCGDVGPLRNGWGQVVMKTYVTDNPNV